MKQHPLPGKQYPSVPAVVYVDIRLRGSRVAGPVGPATRYFFYFYGRVPPAVSSGPAAGRRSPAGNPLLPQAVAPRGPNAGPTATPRQCLWIIAIRGLVLMLLVTPSSGSVLGNMLGGVMGNTQSKLKLSPHADEFGDSNCVSLTSPTHQRKEATMYTRPDRRRATQGFAGARVREVPAEFHEGTCEDFLRRHEIEAVSAAQGTNRQRQRFAGCLLQRAADSRNLRLAIEHLATKGGPAPGPNGLRLRDLDDQERWDLARALSRAIRSGQYRPGPSRKVMIPKGPGRGHRPLRLQNVEDRTVQRAIVQVVQPFVDPHFRLSFGYRPGLGREHALAAAEQLAAAGHRWVWITEDVKDAFENVPHGRLLEVVRRQVPANDLVELIWVIIANRRSKGIRQGSPLSPLLLNLYLHWLLDRRWQHAHPETPLLRAADDLLILCQSRGQAQAAYQELQQAVRQAGMALKGNPEGTIRELAAGQEAHWLG